MLLFIGPISMSRSRRMLLYDASCLCDKIFFAQVFTILLRLILRRSFSENGFAFSCSHLSHCSFIAFHSLTPLPSQPPFRLPPSSSLSFSPSSMFHRAQPLLQLLLRTQLIRVPALALPAVGSSRRETSLCIHAISPPSPSAPSSLSFLSSPPSPSSPLPLAFPPHLSSRLKGRMKRLT